MNAVNSYKIALSMKPFGKARPRCRGKTPPYMPAEYKAKISQVVSQVNANEVPSGPVVVFMHIDYPMPKSWSIAKKDLARDKLCPRKPDIDNVAGAILDAIFPESSGGDSRVVGLIVYRYWSDEPKMSINILKLGDNEYYDDKNSLPPTV